MKDRKILIPLQDDYVAPRFDLAAEVCIWTLDGKGAVTGEKELILPQPTARPLCHLILTESVDVVICGGIEDEYFDYLTWKKIQVIDAVIGPGRRVLDRYVRGNLASGDVVRSSRNTASESTSI